jgi:cation diffusion facilitator CzcD-associated flavoprotein CzcO
MLYRLRQLGLSSRVYEAGSTVGGTWYWNRYPGARCDVPSVDYSYSFSEELQQEWEWTERYPTQPEILTYANHVADRFDLRRDIQFDTRVIGAHFDEGRGQWVVTTDRGDCVAGRFLITAAGCLSSPTVPQFPGLESFGGRWYHTGRWPHEGVDFSGQRVAVIGTGSSAIQAVPVIAETASQLYVFQRTANYVTLGKNEPLDPGYVREVKAEYPARRERARYSRLGIAVEAPALSALEVSPDERERIYEEKWQIGDPSAFVTAFTDVYSDIEANETVAEFVRAKIRAIVQDPAVAELLTPRDHYFGAKRLCISEDYYQAFNRDNVTLVDVKNSPIEEITPGGLRVGDVLYDVDCIIFSTGYDAITGPLLEMDIRNGAGEGLGAKWAEGPATYLGLATAGFPNLLMVTGPGSPSVLANVIMAIEQHVDWISALLQHMSDRGLDRLDVSADAEARWSEEVRRAAEKSFLSTHNAWYLGANIPGKPRVFMPYAGGLKRYRNTCDQVAENAYDGFALTASAPVSIHH